MPEICNSGRKCTLVTLYCSRKGSNSAKGKKFKKIEKKLKEKSKKGNKKSQKKAQKSQKMAKNV